MLFWWWYKMCMRLNRSIHIRILWTGWCVRVDMEWGRRKEVIKWFTSVNNKSILRKKCTKCVYEPSLAFLIAAATFAMCHPWWRVRLSTSGELTRIECKSCTLGALDFQCHIDHRFDSAKSHSLRVHHFLWKNIIKWFSSECTDGKIAPSDIERYGWIDICATFPITFS